jgi:hypothetical protein
MLEYGMTKRQVLDEIYPDEVGFLLDQADLHRRHFFREMTQAVQGDYKKNLERLAGGAAGFSAGPKEEGQISAATNEKAVMTLALWSGNAGMMRKVQLFAQARELLKRLENGE